jgi:hypothetical protein
MEAQPEEEAQMTSRQRRFQRAHIEALLGEADAVVNALSVPDEWRKDCLWWRGEVLVGACKHYCHEWDGLPMDETCAEWPCGCSAETEIHA